MAYVIEIPVQAGGRLLVQATADDLPDTLELASVRPGEVVARARESVEAAINQLKPAINAVTDRLKVFAADEMAVEFGIVLGAEAGAIIAKGTADVHFTVTLNWKRSGRAAGFRRAGSSRAGFRGGAEGCLMFRPTGLSSGSSGRMAARSASARWLPAGTS